MQPWSPSSCPTPPDRLLAGATRARRAVVAAALALLSLVVTPHEAHALLMAGGNACLDAGCDFAPNVFGPGATANIQRLFESTPGINFFTFQAQAAMTLADYDRFSAFAAVSGSADLVVGTPGVGGISSVARANARINDLIYVPGPDGAGTFRMVWHVTGSVAVDWVTTDVLQTAKLSEVQLGFECFAGGLNANCDDVFFQYTQNGAIDETFFIDIPIVFNRSQSYQLQINLGAGTGTGNLLSGTEVGFVGHATGDFASTGTLVDVMVLDAAGNPLDESGILSESLFRYDLVGSSVPEPAILGLAAILTLGVRSRGLRRRIVAAADLRRVH